MLANCVYCKQLYDKQYGRVICSPECRAKHAQALVKERNPERKGKGSAGICEHCGALFVRTSNARSKFCTSECRDIFNMKTVACEKCGATFVFNAYNGKNRTRCLACATLPAQEIHRKVALANWNRKTRVPDPIPPIPKTRLG